MKQVAFIIAVLLTFNTNAQPINHVPNGNFEYYTQCPTNLSQVTNCIGWNSFLSNSSPDYFDSCNMGMVSVPNNFRGTQSPASGHAYMGGYFLTTVLNGNYREMITRDIIPLTIGTIYEVSISASFSEASNIATDNINIFFFDSIGHALTTTDWQAIQPQVTYNSYGIIKDTLNWVRLSTTFYADSAYDNIVIGGFLRDSLINTDTVSQTGTYTYYYIDSVVVKEYQSPQVAISNLDTIICAGDSIEIQFTTTGKFHNSNIFTAQLSDANANFTNPITIDSLISDTSGTLKGVIPPNLPIGTNYRIRILTTVPFDTVVSLPIKIGNMDSASISITSNSPVCEGDSLIFTNNSTPTGLTYSWTGPTSFSSTLAAPFIFNSIPNNSGSYYLTSNIYGCERKDTLQALIKPSPNAPVASSNSPICEYDTLTLNTSSTTTGVTYSWVGPGGYTSNQQNPVRINTPLNAGGFYNAIATLNGCSSYDTINVTVKDNPDTISVSSNSPLCTDDTLKLFSDTSTGNVLYTWSGPNSFTSSANDTQIVNAGIVHTGWYSMTVNLNGCTYTDSTYASVYQTPSAPTLSYNNPLCVGETLSLNANSLVSGVTYSWAGPGNFNSSVKSPVISNAQLSDTGNYTATVNYNGCISPVSTLPVTIKPTPFVVIYASPSDTICDGDNINILSIPANAGNNLSYAWRINAQLQTATGSTYSSTAFKDKDVIVCMMTDSTSCSDPYTDTSNDVQVNVLPWLAPSVSIVANPPGLLKPWEYVQFTATPTNAGNSPLYQWKRNGQDIIGATSNIWSANNLNDNDTIHVELISSYNCPQPANAASNSIVVQIATGINEVAGFYNLTLSPNPNNGQFTLRGMVKQNGTATISVMNMIGQRIYHQQANINQQQLQHEVDLNHVASGLYLLRLEMNGAVTHVKFEVK